MLKRNDQQALKVLFMKFHHVLCHVASRMTGDEDEGKDVVQEVFIKLWRNKAALRIDTSLEAYLKRAVVNTCLNRLTQKKRAAQKLNERWPDNHAENTTELKSNYDELSANIERAISGLPPRTKAVFILIRMNEMSYSEVAASLNISMKAVEKEVMKALKLMRKALKDYLPLLVLLLPVAC